MLPRLALAFALAVVVSPRGASAQTSRSENDPPAPAHVAYVEGVATLERDGRPDSAPLNMPLLSGDRLKTADGRVEVLFADGSALHLDNRTTIDLQSDDLLRLIDGRLRLTIAGPGRVVAYRVDSPAGSIRIAQPGEYRIALLRGERETQLELAVLRGSGQIFTDDGETAVRAGERAYASAGLAPSYAYAYNSANWDAFDRWSESRRDTRLGVSAQYLPSEVRTYASTFDEDGDWRYRQSYGYVWYPRVAVSWRPYYYGRWAQYPRYGWTWIGADRFAWPTHHYGRWGFSAGAWFWIPANRWAPAYVSWAYAPGYVSWCPLGFDNRPVISVNIFNVGPGYYSSSRAWTSIGYSHFGRDYVHRRAVNWDHYDRSRRPAFQAGRAAPAYRDVAVSRNSAPLRWAGSRSVATEGGTRADERLTTVGDRRAGGLTPSAGRNVSGVAPQRNAGSQRGTASVPSSAGTTAVPRYINRGDEIVRSQDGLPSAPAPRSTGVQAIPGMRATAGSSARDGYAVQRTAPGGAARRIDSPAAGVAPGEASGVAVERWRGARDPNAGRYAPRPSYQAPPPRADAPAYQPQFSQPQGYQPQPYQPPTRTFQPGDGSQGRSRAPQPRAAAPNRDSQSSAPPQSARPRGGDEPRSAPAPAERSAPSHGTAVPRDSGGRGAAPGGSGMRSRGRGGA